MRTQHLFILLAMGEAMFALMAGDESHTITLHDTYIIVAQAHVRWGIFLLALLFAAAYAMMQRVRRPIGGVTGWVHFSFTIVGLLLPALAMVMKDGTCEPIGSTSALVGVLLFLAGPLVFLFGLVMALLRSPGIPGGA